VGVLIGAVIVGIALGVPTTWVTAFQIATSFVTLTMVFVIQHTQGREQAATQRKLDELLRALPEADTGLMMLEEAPDEVLRKVEIEQRSSREQAPRPDDLEW
jgi:low affinity Fe/Cu permease